MNMFWWNGYLYKENQATKKTTKNKQTNKKLIFDKNDKNRPFNPWPTLKILPKRLSIMFLK